MGLIREMERAWRSKVLTLVHKKRGDIPLRPSDIPVHRRGGRRRAPPRNQVRWVQAHRRHRPFSWIHATEMKGKDADDSSFVMRHISEKALRMMRSHLRELLEGRVEEKSFERIERMLLGGENVHSLPISSKEAREMGLFVTTDVPPQVHLYMSTFRSVKGSVEYLK